MSWWYDIRPGPGKKKPPGYPHIINEYRLAGVLLQVMLGRVEKFEIDRWRWDARYKKLRIYDSEGGQHILWEE